jgi:membrane protein
MRWLAGMRRLGAWVTASLRGRDLALHAAATTFYGAIAVVPVALLTIRLAALLAGQDRVSRLAGTVVTALPTDIGADRAAGALVAGGLGLTLVPALSALLPASLYGEGLRRAFVSLGEPGERLVGWRGRLLVLPLLAAGPALLLALLAVLPTAIGLLDRGGWVGFGGIVVSFLATWLALTAVLVWVYRVVGPRRPGAVPVLLGAAGTAANVSGFVHGFVLFCSLPLDLGLPFGGFDAVGGVVAVLLWLYLFHTLVLLGYAVTVRLPDPGVNRR